MDKTGSAMQIRKEINLFVLKQKSHLVVVDNGFLLRVCVAKLLSVYSYVYTTTSTS